MTAANISHLPEPSPPRRTRKKATDAAIAEANAADDGYVTIEQCGVTLRLPVGGKISLAAIDMFRDGDNFGGMKELLGEKQWELLKSAGGTSDDLDELAGKLGSGN